MEEFHVGRERKGGRKIKDVRIWKSRKHGGKGKKESMEKER